MKRLLPIAWIPHLAATALLALAAAAAPAAPPTPAAGAPASPGGAGMPVNAASAPAAAPRVIEHRLDNGLTLFIKPDRRAPTAVHMVWVRVGSVDEVDGESGIAHVVEHMLFKGTAELGPGEFSRRVAALGGRENAFTSRDATGYHQQIPASRLAELMRLEADRFARNQWPDEEFRREIEVVKEERRLRTEDSPRAMLWEQLNAVAFVASPYRRPIVGWMSDLDAMTADDVRAFWRRWYVPENAAVVVAGDVDPQEVLRLARETYGAIPARAVPPRKPRTEPPQAGPRRVEHRAPAEQGYVALAFKVPQLAAFDDSESTRDALALTVLAAVLAGHDGARLPRALTQGAQRVADSASAWYGLWGRGPQLFVLDAVPAPGRSAAEAEAALREQVARIAREGIAEAELRRVSTRWTAAEVYKLDSLFNQAREIGQAWVLGLPPDAGSRLMARLRGVTPADVQRVAARWFGDDALTVGVLTPLPPQPAPRRAPPLGLRH